MSKEAVDREGGWLESGLLFWSHPASVGTTQDSEIIPTSVLSPQPQTTTTHHHDPGSQSRVLQGLLS